MPIHLECGESERIFVKFSQDGGTVVTVADKNTVRIWNASNAKLLNQFDVPGVITAVLSPEGSKIVTSLTEGFAKVWNAQTGKHLYTLDVPKIISASFGNDFNKDVVFTVSTLDDKLGIAKRLKIWNAMNGEFIHSSLALVRPLESDVFSPDRTKIVITSAKGTVSIYDYDMFQVGRYFSNKTLSLKNQALLVALDGLSRQKNGLPIKKEDLFAYANDIDATIIFSSIPDHVKTCLRKLYRLDDDIFSNVNYKKIKEKLAIKQK